MDVKILSILLCFVGASYGHGRLMEPPSRASQWRFGFENPPDYNDNQGFCGGKIHQHQEMEGRCGICGDPYDGPLEHQAPGGKFANGNIVANYLQGSWIDIAIEVTTNHLGFFEFRLCPNNDVTQDPEQDCFDQYLLQTDSGSERFPVTDWRRGFWNSSIRPTFGSVDENLLDLEISNMVSRFSDGSK